MSRRTPAPGAQSRTSAWWQTAGSMRMPDLRTFLPRRGDYAGVRSGWRADALAGLTVGVVALP
ncbi:MAG: hypothetical protein LH650_01185, partial [Chloroflexi bacterium]|nr:hypothetical protein [Chloroflexota bacterium]